MVFGKEDASLGEFAFERVQVQIFLPFTETQAELVRFLYKLIGLVSLVGKPIELKIEIIVNARVLKASGFGDGVPQAYICAVLFFLIALGFRLEVRRFRHDVKRD